MRKYRKHSLWLCFLMLANVFAICGCTGKLFAKLGFDTYDYHSEPVIANHDPDAIHVMKKSKYSGKYGDYSSYSDEIDTLNVIDDEENE